MSLAEQRQSQAKVIGPIPCGDSPVPIPYLISLTARTCGIDDVAATVAVRLNSPISHTHPRLDDRHRQGVHTFRLAQTQ